MRWRKMHRRLTAIRLPRRVRREPPLLTDHPRQALFLVHQDWSIRITGGRNASIIGAGAIGVEEDAVGRSTAAACLDEEMGESDRRWWWVFQVFVVAFLATAVVLLSLGVKDRLLTIYSFSSAVGWLAGAVTYFSWSTILRGHQRKKQLGVTWLLWGVSVAALLGFIWWLHYTVRFDLALPAAALIDPIRPAQWSR